MDISDQGIAFIQSWEAFLATPTVDAFGVTNIGYGHVVRPGEVFTSLPQEQATDLLRQDLEPHVGNVNSGLTIELSQNQFDALCSFDYNTGSFNSSTLRSVINQGGGDDAVRAQFMRWVNANGQPVQGLVNRRAAECNVYFDGNYSRN